MDWNKVLDVIVNKIHIALAAVCQGVILLFHFKTGKDIGSGVQNTVYAYYAFLAGHNLTNQKFPDPPDPPATGTDTPKG
jgi:hypothetical protein